MLNLSESAVHVVASDSRTAVADYDQNFISSLRLAANAVEGLQGSNIPALQSQRLYQAFTDSIGKQIESRKSLVSAISQLLVIQQHSNQAETDAGCPLWYRNAMPAPSAINTTPDHTAPAAV